MAGCDESDRLVKRDGLGIGHHVDARRTPVAGNPLGVLDESTPDAGAHPVGVDEETVEFASIRSSLKQDCETDNNTVLLGDANQAGRDLRRGQFDRVRVVGKLRPVQRVVR